MNPAQHLQQQLQLHKPSSILFASRSPAGYSQIQHSAMFTTVYDALLAYCATNDGEIHCIDTQTDDWEQLARCDFSVVVDFLEHLPKTTGIQRLGQLRNLLSQRIWVLINRSPAWGFNDFIGLGFSSITPSHADGQESASDEPGDWDQLQCYGYDLATYNRVRSWNNPRHWANPENFGKYRW